MTFTIPLDVYECKVVVITVPTTKDVCIQINKLAKKHKRPLPNNEGDLAWGQVINTLEYYYVVLSQTSLNSFDVPLHELMHLVLTICGDRGIEDEEAKAYLQGYVGNKILKNLKNVQ